MPGKGNDQINIWMSIFQHPSQSILPPRTRVIRKLRPSALPEMPSCETKAKRSRVWPRSSNGRLRQEGNTSTQSSRLDSLRKKTIVTNRLTGNFPGSPIELEFVFTLVGDKIVSLEILS